MFSSHFQTIDQIQPQIELSSGRVYRIGFEEFRNTHTQTPKSMTDKMRKNQTKNDKVLKEIFACYPTLFTHAMYLFLFSSSSRRVVGEKEFCRMMNANKKTQSKIKKKTTGRADRIRCISTHGLSRPFSNE